MTPSIQTKRDATPIVPTVPRFSILPDGNIRMRFEDGGEYAFTPEIALATADCLRTMGIRPQQ